MRTSRFVTTGTASARRTHVRTSSAAAPAADRARVVRVVALAVVIAAACSACVTGSPPPTFVAGTYPVTATVGPQSVAGLVDGCTVTGATAPVVLTAAEVTVPVTSVVITEPVINLTGLTVDLAATTVDAGTVELACPGTATVTAGVHLRVADVSVTRSATIGRGISAALAIVRKVSPPSVDMAWWIEW